MGNDLHRDRVERATVDTLERVERALRDLGLPYLPLRVRDAIVDGMQWAYRAAQRPVARAALPATPVKRISTHPKPGLNQTRRPVYHHRSAILPPPSPRARQTTMEIRPEDWILPGDDDPTDPMIRKPKG